MKTVPIGFVPQPDGSFSKPKGKLRDLPPSEPHKGRESELHDQIEAELKRRRWYYVHSRTDKRTTQGLGVPDFIIAAPDRLIFRGGGSDTQLARTYWIEVKRKRGKLSQEQAVTKHVLTALGHRHHVVYSFKEF